MTVPRDYTADAREAWRGYERGKFKDTTSAVAAALEAAEKRGRVAGLREAARLIVPGPVGEVAPEDAASDALDRYEDAILLRAAEVERS